MMQGALVSEGIKEVFKIDNYDPRNNADLFSDEYLAKINLPNTKIKLLQKLLSQDIEEFREKIEFKQ
jgi:type I restriction enzyme, R subunit